MPHRTFKDAGGQKWDVWTVLPTKVERRARGAELRDEDRRRHTEYRVALGPAFANGWLCFECDAEKRRLAPIPDQWETCPDDELRRLLDEATPIAIKAQRARAQDESRPR